MGREPLSAMYEVDQNRDAYREGLFARALGRSCDGNPYPEHSRDALLWIHGWWLIPDGRETAPTEFEHESPSSLTYFALDEVSPIFSREHDNHPIRRLWIQMVEPVRHLLRGLLLAAAVFCFSYAVLHVFLLW
jgi:hypothetical protein